MAFPNDTSRFPSIEIDALLTISRPVGSIVHNDGALWRSISAVAASYERIGGVQSGAGDPNGVVLGVRGALFISNSGVEGNPTVYQNIDAVSGTVWAVIATAGSSGVGFGPIFSTAITPTGVTTVVVANGVLATDRAFVQIQSDDTGASLGTCIGALCAANQVTVTFTNGAGLNDDSVVAVTVFRP